MLQNYSRYKLLQVFFDYPKKDFQIRELSRKIRLAQISIINHLKRLVKENLVIKENKSIYPSYKANTNNELFKLLKKQNLILRLKESGLIEFLEERLRPNCIVLFGSASRGEDNENSDTDIFLQSKEVILDLNKFEKSLNRKINLFFEYNINKLNKELLNNIINGEVLHGYLKVF